MIVATRGSFAPDPSAAPFHRHIEGDWGAAKQIAVEPSSSVTIKRSGGNSVCGEPPAHEDWRFLLTDSKPTHTHAGLR